MEIDELKEKNLQKQLRKEAIRTKLEIVRPEQTRNDWSRYCFYIFDSCITSAFSFYDRIME